MSLCIHFISLRSIGMNVNNRATPPPPPPSSLCLTFISRTQKTLCALRHLHRCDSAVTNRSDSCKRSRPPDNWSAPLSFSTQLTFQPSLRVFCPRAACGEIMWSEFLWIGEVESRSVRWSTSPDVRGSQTDNNHNSRGFPTLCNSVYAACRVVGLCDAEIWWLVELLHCELAFPLAVLFWCVVVACHVARLWATHFRWSGNVDARPLEVRGSRRIKEEQCQRNKERPTERNAESFFPPVSAKTVESLEAVKPQQRFSRVLC